MWAKSGGKAWPVWAFPEYYDATMSALCRALRVVPRVAVDLKSKDVGYVFMKTRPSTALFSTPGCNPQFTSSPVNSARFHPSTRPNTKQD